MPKGRRRGNDFDISSVRLFLLFIIHSLPAPPSRSPARVRVAAFAAERVLVSFEAGSGAFLGCVSGLSSSNVGKFTAAVRLVQA